MSDRRGSGKNKKKEKEKEKEKEGDKDGKDKEKPKENDKVRGTRPLHLAVERRQDKIISLLVSAGADLNAQDRAGKTALMLAVPHLPSKYS